MERGPKWSWAQRQELHLHLHYAKSPSTSPMEAMVKEAILCFFDGVDAQAHLEQKVPAFVAKRAVDKARVWLGNERGKRRRFAAEILERRNQYKNANQFTSGNLRVTIDNAQDRNYGMVNVTIYSVVEVWEEGERLDPEKSYLTNFSDFKTKEWLSKLLVWALMNNREVLIRAATEVEMTTMRMFVPKDRVA